MAVGIENIVHKRIDGDVLAEQARKDVQQYTWGERARKIITLFNE
jgi:hypothetical protein